MESSATRYSDHVISKLLKETPKKSENMVQPNEFKQQGLINVEKTEDHHEQIYNYYQLHQEHLGMVKTLVIIILVILVGIAIVFIIKYLYKKLRQSFMMAAAQAVVQQ